MYIDKKNYEPDFLQPVQLKYCCLLDTSILLIAFDEDIPNNGTNASYDTYDTYPAYIDELNEFKTAGKCIDERKPIFNDNKYACMYALLTLEKER